MSFLNMSIFFILENTNENYNQTKLKSTLKKKLYNTWLYLAKKGIFTAKLNLVYITVCETVSPLWCLLRPLLNKMFNNKSKCLVT